MSKKRKNYTRILLGISISAVAIAMYFAYKVKTLTTRVVKQTAVIIDDGNNADQENIAMIDSLLFAGNYSNALKLSVELRQNERFINDSALQLRYKLASDIVTTKEKTTTLSQSAPRADMSNLISSTTIVRNNDSLSLELKKQKDQVVQLARRLNEKPIVEYLTFKTSKGTKLHYVGTVNKGNANGYGVALLDSGSRYEGDWLDNKRHGKGKFYWDDGETYEGAYVNDMREGTGTYHWKNGEKYVGEWKDDMRNGKGEFYNKKGKLKTTGIWKDDVLAEEEKSKAAH